MNRQGNRRSPRVSCVPKMKSLIENNGSALRQMAQRKRRRMRLRALITIQQNKRWDSDKRRREDQKSGRQHGSDTLLSLRSGHGAFTPAAAAAVWNARRSVLESPQPVWTRQNADGVQRARMAGNAEDPDSASQQKRLFQPNMAKIIRFNVLNVG